jgi:hypothetical protein
MQALLELQLQMGAAIAKRFLQAAVGRFQRLKRLHLISDVEANRGAMVDCGLLHSMALLEELHIFDYKSLVLEGNMYLPRIKKLSVMDITALRLDAVLPSLQQLEVSEVPQVMLSGGCLQLPQLSQLSQGSY